MSVAPESFSVPFKTGSFIIVTDSYFIAAFYNFL